MSARPFALALALVACGDPAGPAELGVLKGGIISGREQTVTAGASKLPEAVVEQVVRTPAGIVMRRVPMWERAILPTVAHAQTTVNGSPVPGAVVCVYEQDKDLVPFSRCTNTDALGKATFFFAPPTKAGNYIARINGSVTVGQRVEATTFDTVKVSVAAGAADSLVVFEQDPQPSPFRVARNGIADAYGNPIPFRVPADARLTPRDTVLGADSSRFVTFANVPADTVVHSLVLTGANNAPLVRLWYRIRNVNGVPTMSAKVCGLKATCTIP